ncbi:MAG: right-handed parallel beta-helix repeat-containing protein [Chitinophagaceae bacterium]|nr:right-handed parallel beta-helix repeat-containing protein [Chitinophagaceae bacterium]
MKRFIVFGILLFPLIGAAQNFFTQPVMNFISKPTESIVDVSFSSPSVATFQSDVNNLRASNPTALIRITVSGTVNVGSAPMILSDKMLMRLENATIQATTSATATELISVENAKYVSITADGNSIIDGKSKSIKGIYVNNSGKTHIDNLIIKNCNNGGIDYLGRGMAVYADAGSITRSVIQSCTSFGIQIDSVNQFVITDNAIQSCGEGIKLDGDYAAVANNSISYCTKGISAISEYEAITYNTITNCTTGIELTSASNETLISYNTISSNTTGLNLNGAKTRVYYNKCNNTTEINGSGTSIQLFSNNGITSTEGNRTGFTYFNPPLIGNQHTDLVKIGKTRYDININGGNLLDARATIDNAHTAQPNAVVVVHLNGSFSTNSTTDSLLVKEDECYLLDGTIGGNDSTNTIIYFKNSSTVSFSGGTINGNSANGKNALVYITGSATVIFDSVSVLNSAHEGITKRNSFIPTYIRACYIDNSKTRGLWQLAADRMFAFQNICINSKMDGIDLDAYTTTSVVMKNISSTNVRHGVFIEEGANRHLVMGNTLNGNNTGVSFYNMAVENKNTNRNMVVSNICRQNNRGIQMNASAVTKATIDNYLFNNILESNADVGIGGYYNKTNTSNNYSALNTQQYNTNGPFYAQADFESNTVWSLFNTSSGTLPVKFSLFTGKLVQNIVELNWETATEIDSKVFNIQAGTKPTVFKTIGTVAAAGNSTKSLVYNFSDPNPVPGTNYYRIQQVDKNGKVLFSTVVKIDYKPATAFNIKCFNLSNDSMNLQVNTSQEFKNMDIGMYSLVGTTVFKKQFTSAGSYQLNEVIRFPNAGSGVYVLTAQTETGSDTKKIFLTR